MLIKKFNNLASKDLKLYLKYRQFIKSFNRALSTSKVSNVQRQDFIVKSPLPSLTYPNLSIDQYIWQDVGKWMNKTAIVSCYL